MNKEDDLATKIYGASQESEWPEFVTYVNKLFVEFLDRIEREVIKRKTGLVIAPWEMETFDILRAEELEALNEIRKELQHE